MIEGELALRANANRQLKDIEKRLLQLDQLVPASPLVKGSDGGLGSMLKLRGESREKLLEAKEELEKQVCVARPGGGEGGSSWCASDSRRARALRVEARKAEGPVAVPCLCTFLPPISALHTCHMSPCLAILCGRIWQPRASLPTKPAISAMYACVQQPWPPTPACMQVASHNASISDLQAQWEAAKADEEGRGGGAVDARRWVGVRNVVESRDLLRTLFRLSSDMK